MGLTKQQSLAVNECGQNIIVSAGAGSGKTKVLSERVIERLTNPKFKWDIDEMLILTFTNAAAKNMKARIRGQLLLNNKLEKDELKKQLNKIDSAYIMTFDAYSKFLIDKYHQIINVDCNCKVIDDNLIKIKTKEFLNEIMLQEYQNKDKRFIKLVNDFCIKDDKNLRKEIINLNNKLNTLYNRKKYFDDYEKTFYSDEAINKNINDYLDILLDKIKLIDKLLNDLSEYVEIDKLYPGINALLRSRSIRDIKDNLDFKIGRMPNGSEQAARNINNNIKKKIEELKGLVEGNEESYKNEILNTKEDTLYLLKLADRLNDKLLLYKKENNSFEFFDIFNMAIELLDNHQDITDEIKNQFKEILIDEYQDTNDLQDEFIKRISNNNVYMVGDIKQSIYRFRNANPKIFTDKYEAYSQNINGEKIDLTMNFRSRKEVLDSVNDVFSRIMDVKVGGANYLAGHNMVAGNLNYEKLGYGKVDKQSFETEILSYPFDKDAREKFPFDVLKQHEVEAFIIANDIEDKIKNHYQVTYQNVEEDENGKQIEVMRTRDCRYEDFTILIDRKNEFDTIKQILTSRNIPCEILTEEDLNESDLLSVIESTFKIITCMVNKDYNYDFKFAYCSLARSFISNMSDDELYEIVTNNGYFKSSLFQKLAKIVDNIEIKNLTNILDEIIKTFDIYSNIRRIGDVQKNIIKINYLYQMAKTLNEAGYCYADFNDYLVAVFDESDDTIKYKIQKENKNVVKITNIHQSKGLEYPICYYPILYKGFNDQEIRSSFMFSKEQGLIIPTMITGKGLKNTIRRDIFVRNYKLEDIGEKIRLFYVALTRAKEKIIMLCPVEDKNESGRVISQETRLDIKCFKDMLDVNYHDIAKYIKEININLCGHVFNKDYKLNKKDIFKAIEKTSEIIEINKLVEIKPIEVEDSSFSKKVGLVDEEIIKKMELGTRLHYYLETLDFMKPNFELIDEKQRQYIKKFLDSELMKDAAKGKAYKEYEFIYQENNQRKHGFIDLLMEYDDHFDIIDYKTKNIDDEHYDQQLNGYRKYLKSISDKKINCYLYSIIDGTIREIK